VRWGEEFGDHFKDLELGSLFPFMLENDGQKLIRRLWSASPGFAGSTFGYGPWLRHLDPFLNFTAHNTKGGYAKSFTLTCITQAKYELAYWLCHR